MERFPIIKQLAESDMSDVFLAFDKELNKKVVIKKIPFKQLRVQEVAANKQLSIDKKFKGVAQYVADYADEENHYLVLKWCEGQDLSTYLEQQNFVPFKEKRAKKIFRCIVNTVLYLHQHGIVHRDLKLENMIYNHKKRDSKNCVTVIDLGLCDFIDNQGTEVFKEFVGSPEYAPPELLLEKPYCGQKADVYSLGVILFVLLFADFPFKQEERAHSLSNNQEHPQLVFPPPITDDQAHRVSDAVKDLIESMLQTDPDKRIPLEEVSKHKWLRS